MEVEVYKVVRFGYGFENGVKTLGLWSVVPFCNRALIRYQLGRKIQANIKGTPVFCFSNLRDAEKMLSRYIPLTILVCHGEMFEHQYSRLIDWSCTAYYKTVDRMILADLEYAKRTKSTNPLNGTILMDWIEPFAWLGPVHYTHEREE